MEHNFRTLNYLGSKFRLLDFIEDNILSLTKEGEGVCDLFAGSGCVSYKLSEKFSVTSCDIQEYSKVICDALIRKYEVSEKDVMSLIDAICVENKLIECFSPLIELEENAIEYKNLEVLTEILENGSVEVYNLEHKVSSLAVQQKAVSDNLHNCGLYNEKSLISRYYGGVYFSYRQAAWIDIILENINIYVSDSNRSLFLAALLSTASDIVDTVGKHFAQPIKARDSKGNIKITVYNKAIKDKTIDVVGLYKEWFIRYFKLDKSEYKFNSVKGDYLDCLKNLPNSVKTVYADPPYTRDHYSRFYHVLETIALRDSPELSTTNIRGNYHVSNGIYRKDRHQSPFCIKSQAPDAFKAMFDIVSKSGRSLLLSYSPYDETKRTHPRVVTIQQLMTWASEYFTSVETTSAGMFKHNKLNSIDRFLDASDEAELLIICTNQ